MEKIIALPNGRTLRAPTIRALRARHFPFRLAGQFLKPARRDGNIVCAIDVPYGVPGIYCWGIGTQAVYLGSSESIRRRNQDHGNSRAPGAGQYCQRKLREAVERGRTVKVYVIEDPRTEWQGLNLSIVLSLEAAMLRAWLFPWNMMRPDPVKRDKSEVLRKAWQAANVQIAEADAR